MCPHDNIEVQNITPDGQRAIIVTYVCTDCTATARAGIDLLDLTVQDDFIVNQLEWSIDG